MSEINIIPIGSGSTGNCFFIKMFEYQFLIDMGIGVKQVSKALNSHGFDLKDINFIFVSHGHNDHVKSHEAICNNTDCVIYTNETVLYSIRKANAEKVVLEIEEEIKVCDDFSVKMISLPHDFVKTCGFIFKCHGRKIAYVTDCGMMNDKILKELYDSYLVILESNHDLDMLKNGPYPKFLQDRVRSKYGHLSNDDCAKTVKKLYEKGTRNFILAHVSLKNNTKQLAYDTTYNALKCDDAYIYVCEKESEDLLCF